MLNHLSIVAVAVALGLDAFSVGVSAGVAELMHDRRAVLRLSLSIGVFHVVMCSAGYLLGSNIGDIFSHYDHWVAFLLLSFVGVKMIADSRKKGEERHGGYITRGVALFMVSVATSIDALVVGVSFGLIDVPIFFASVIIGFTAALMLCCGIFLGDRIGIIIGRRAAVVGGIAVVIIGLKILWGHIG